MANVDHSQRKHALLSASGASRWINCTPSPRLEEKEEDKGSSFAAEGTLAHEFCDIGLQLASGRISEGDYKKQAEQLEKQELFHPEMYEHAQTYVDYVMDEYKAAQSRTEDAVLLIEEKVDYSEYVEEGFGTGDDVIIADRILDIGDFKYGKGVKVSAEDNDQLKLYGLGALLKYDMMYDIETVRLTVIQPRLDHIDSWDISKEDLYKWAEEVARPKAKLAYAGDGEQKPGPWCKFCKVKPKCRALADESLAMAKHDFADPLLLEDDEIMEAFKQADTFIDWFKSLGEYVLATALDGKHWPGYKIVEGRSNRKWVNEDKVKEVLQDNAFSDTEFLNTKLKGIGDIEKLVGKKDFPKLLGAHVVKPEGKPTLVPESDKRPARGAEQAIKDFLT